MRVGFRKGLVEDEGRRDWGGDGPRPISWAAWYPAADEAVEADMIVGGPAASWFDIGAAARDAPVRRVGTPWPVVLISHGTGGTAMSMGWLARRLAQRGFVAIAANHHGNTAIEPYKPEGFLCWWERARDLSVLLDRLPIEAGLRGCIDATRAFVAGFSLGGHTAMSLLGAITEIERFQAWAGNGRFGRGPREFPDLADRFPALMATSAVLRASWDRQSASYRDDRIRAALLLAPAPAVRAFTKASLARIVEPVHIMVGGSDREAPAEDGAIWLSERLPRSTVDRLAHDVGHYVFLPESTDEGRRVAPHLCRDAPVVDRRAIHDAAAQAAVALFRMDRGNDTGSDSP